jgi:hypothetical protein
MANSATGGKADEEGESLVRTAVSHTAHSSYGTHSRHSFLVIAFAIQLSISLELQLHEANEVALTLPVHII